MKLLYLAYAFPPSPAIGSVRSWNTAKWLSTLGWDVTVVTPEADLWRRPEYAPALPGGVRTLPTGHAWPMLAPEQVKWGDHAAARALGGACRVAARRLGLEPAAGWELSALAACSHLGRGAHDLVLATASPFGAFRLARKLSRRLDCPYVLDYRDPWTSNPHKAKGDPREEEDLLRDCARATVVSPSWAGLIGGAFGVAEKMDVVTNGFDPELFAGVEPARFEEFSIVYAGTLYPPKRALGPALRAFQRWGGRGRFHYYGDHAPRVAEEAASLGLADRVEIHGRVSRAEALAAQKGADLVVVVASVEEEGGPADRGVVTGKVFDCMALGRPALVVAPRGSDLYEIAGKAGGMRCFTGSDVEGMARYIGDVAAGRLPPAGEPAAYRWDNVSRRLDAALRTALA